MLLARVGRRLGEDSRFGERCGLAEEPQLAAVMHCREFLEEDAPEQPRAQTHRQEEAGAANDAPWPATVNTLKNSQNIWRQFQRRDACRATETRRS